MLAGLIGVPVTAAAGGTGLGVVWGKGDLDTTGRVGFTNRLAIPPLAGSRVDRDGRRIFDLAVASGQRQLRPGRPTGTWGVNGDFLGPTIRATRGETVVIHVRNRLPEPTTLHWHGMHLPARMDGGPHQPIEPGTTWSPTWTIDQPAATLWYHPHPHGQTAQHVYRGLAGVFILDDPDAEPAGLPSEYGVDDLPVIVQDKRFDGDNQLDESDPAFSPIGILGDTILVNGTPAPYHQVDTERLRLRLLNASNARSYNFGFADDRRFDLIGTDGGLLAAPHATNRIRLSPGERAEIVAAVEPGERAVLQSYPAELGIDFWNQRFSGGDDRLDILQLRAAPQLRASPPLPAALAEPARVDVSAVAATRTFALSGTKINDLRMDMGRIDQVVEIDTTEVWEIVNRAGRPHNFHIHDVQFQIQTVDGNEPVPELRGWKDTIYLPPKVPISVALRFTDYTDPDVPYMYHCHLLSHEDRGMMGQFVVVEPGQAAGTPPLDHNHHAEGS